MIRLHNDDWGFDTNCFVCEPSNPAGLQIPFFHDTDRGLVLAEFRALEGPSPAGATATCDVVVAHRVGHVVSPVMLSRRVEPTGHRPDGDRLFTIR
jgi:hypothetical protein